MKMTYKGYIILVKSMGYSVMGKHCDDLREVISHIHTLTKTNKGN